MHVWVSVGMRACVGGCEDVCMCGCGYVGGDVCGNVCMCVWGV